MGKSCLNKLSGNVTIACTIAPVGVKGLYLIHSEDVTLTTDTNALSVLTASFTSGAVVTFVEGYKQNIQITGAIRSMDASAKVDINVTFKMSRTLPGTIARVRSLLSGKFYVLAEYADGTNMFIGYTSPLECSGLDWDSNANAGLVTVSLAAPEGSAGNYFMAADAATVSSIKAKVGG